MKKQIVLFLMALLPVVAWAFTGEIEIDGIKYNVVTRAKEAKVIKKDSQYTGDIVIPASIVVEDVECAVTSIGEYAFRYCTGLTSVTIPSSITSIGNEAFFGCTGLTSVHITDIAAWCNIAFEDNPLGHAHHLFLNGEEIKDLIIPSSVTTIGGRAFSGCTGLTSVTIPSSVTTIDYSAFEGCTSLTSITIPSSVTTIYYSAFGRCTGLTSITIPSSVTTIGGGAFSGCTGLTSVTIPSSVTSIEGYAFSGCTGLTSITIPSSVTTIGGGAFYGCTGLTSVTIPSSVTSIWSYAFYGCTSLTSITIPSSVTTIDYSAFEGCTELADVYCYAETAPRTYSNLFEGSYIEYSTLHVPASAIDAYRTTEPWSKFGTIVAIDGDEPVVPEPDQCEKPTIYYANGKLSFKSATEGVQFVSEITDADVRKNYTVEVDLSVTYAISVYATKEGYKDSEVATATLCWIEVEPQKEGITDDEVSVSEVKAVPVLIQADGRQIVITGAADGTPISVFSINGMQAGSAISQNGKTTIPVQLPGNIAIVKIGDRSVKVRRD